MVKKKKKEENLEYFIPLDLIKKLLIVVSIAKLV